jgi:hypothetical protein
MEKVKILLGLSIFLAALSLFLFGPEQHEPSLAFAGLILHPRTATALSIILMVFGAVMTLKSFAEWKFQ